MKKVLIVGCVLLLCCCVSSIAGFAAIGYFESNGGCVYRGPFASVSSGACMATTGTSLVSNNTNSNNNQNVNSNTTDQVYTGAYYSLTYPQEFFVDDSDDSLLFVYADNELDNLNISRKNYTITISQSDCEEYAANTLDELYLYDAMLENVGVTTIGGYKACKVDFNADYGTDSGRINQTQYYISVGSKTYFETITINLNESNYDSLDNVARSIQFN